MSNIPDPFALFEGGVAHRVDINIAEALTGVRGRSISRHTVEPVVQAGMKPRNAIALLHWTILGVVAVVGVAVLGRRR